MTSPVDEQQITSNVQTAGTSLPVVYGFTTCNAGDTIIVVMRCAVAVTTTWPSGWTTFLIHDVSPDAANDVNTVVVRKADGSETGGLGTNFTVTSDVSTKMAAVAYRISGAADPTVTSPEISTAVTGTSVNPDPGSRSVTGGPKDILALALDLHAGEQTTTVTYPTNYTNTGQVTSGTAGAIDSNCQINYCSRQLSAVSSEDPGAFTISTTSTGWTAYTIVVHPSAAAAATSLIYPPGMPRALLAQ